MNDVLKAAALGVAIGAGAIGGLYLGSKAAQGIGSGMDALKAKWGKSEAQKLADEALGNK